MLATKNPLTTAARTGKRYVNKSRSLRIPSKQRSAIFEILQQHDESQKREPGTNDPNERLKHLRANLPLDLFLRYYFLGRKSDFTA